MWLWELLQGNLSGRTWLRRQGCLPTSSVRNPKATGMRLFNTPLNYICWVPVCLRSRDWLMFRICVWKAVGVRFWFAPDGSSPGASADSSFTLVSGQIFARDVTVLCWFKSCITAEVKQRKLLHIWVLGEHCCPASEDNLLFVLFNMFIREEKSIVIVTISVKILLHPRSEAHICKPVLCLRRSIRSTMLIQCYTL